MERNKIALGILLLTAFLLPLQASSHPPKDIVMEFDTVTKVLKVKAVHPVKPDNLSKHFISYIKVSLDKNVAVEQNFQSQTNPDGQEVSYTLIDAKEGAKITVEAKCNIYGTGKKELIISEDKTKVESKTENK